MKVLRTVPKIYTTTAVKTSHSTKIIPPLRGGAQPPILAPIKRMAGPQDNTTPRKEVAVRGVPLDSDTGK